MTFCKSVYNGVKMKWFLPRFPRFIGSCSRLNSSLFLYLSYTTSEMFVPKNRMVVGAFMSIDKISTPYVWISLYSLTITVLHLEVNRSLKKRMQYNETEIRYKFGFLYFCFLFFLFLLERLWNLNGPIWVFYWGEFWRD